MTFEETGLPECPSNPAVSDSLPFLPRGHPTTPALPTLPAQPNVRSQKPVRAVSPLCSCLLPHSRKATARFPHQRGRGFIAFFQLEIGNGNVLARDTGSHRLLRACREVQLRLVVPRTHTTGMATVGPFAGQSASASPRNGTACDSDGAQARDILDRSRERLGVKPRGTSS
ncbi:MAG: hypothetical protein MZV64_14825 [Ignavibacteriales bacterium]|nr:hypothetical protein [Ignavibacteriales bacterium]